MIFMGTNTAAATVTFSDDWDAEEPTVRDAAPARLARISDWQDRTGTWTVSDEELRLAFQSLGEDPTATCRDLPVVRS
jgi:hypothetical protein